MFWYGLFKAALFRPVVRGLFRAKITGAENIPATGPVLLASNHLSAGETFVLPAMVRRRMTFPAKAELFRGDRGLGSKIVAGFLRLIGQIPLDRSGGRVSMAALGPVLDELAAGGAVGIFPEGKRSPDGRLYKGKTGVARLALASGAPVVPIAMFDTQTVRTRLGVPWIRRPRIVVGEPLRFDEYRGGVDDHAVLRWVTDEVMNAIMELSGQTYVDLYASSVASGSVSAADAQARVRPRPGGKGAPAVPGPDGKPAAVRDGSAAPQAGSASDVDADVAADPVATPDVAPAAADARRTRPRRGRASA